MQDTKAAQETKALQEFYSRLSTDSARAFYGSGHVMAAHELQAIQTLLISDRLFRTNDVAKVCTSAKSVASTVFDLLQDLLFVRLRGLLPGRDAHGYSHKA